MQEKSKRSLVFGVVAVIAIGSTIAGAGLGRGTAGKMRETEARLLPGTSPAANRAAAASGAAVPIMPEYKIALRDLEGAKLAASYGPVLEGSALARVLEHAEHIDQRGSLFASIAAAKLIDSVADRVDANPALLDDRYFVAALRMTSFVSSRRPLEGERRHAIGVLGGVPAQVPLRTAGYVESVSSEAMEEVSATLHEMEDSALAGNLEQCQTAAQKPRGLAKQVTVGPSICKSALRVASSGRRLRALQARAYKHARRAAAIDL
jgi:hypothetical protein